MKNYQKNAENVIKKIQYRYPKPHHRGTIDDAINQLEHTKELLVIATKELGEFAIGYHRENELKESDVSEINRINQELISNLIREANS